MPQIVNPYVLPARPQRPPGFGASFGQGLNEGLDLLLQAFLSGQLGRTPTQGSYVSPSGHGTMLSPAEQVAGNPTRTLSDVLARQRPVGAEFTRAGFPLRFQPPLTRELQQAQLAESQGNLRKLPAEIRKTEAEAKLSESIAGSLAGTGGSQGAIVSLSDSTGQEVPTGSPESRKYLKRVTSSGISYTPVPETTEDRLGAERASKSKERTEKLSTAVRRLSLVNKQFQEAFPSGDRSELFQRAVGTASSIGVRLGLVKNPELLALQKNIRPMAINLIRAFGEVGNLSESEQAGAIDVVSQANLTDTERVAQTKQFIEFALAGADPNEVNQIVKEQPDIQEILTAFGVNISGIAQGVSSGTTGEDFSQYSDDELRAILAGQ